jgi:Mg-chelatase subunit ChlD
MNLLAVILADLTSPLRLEYLSIPAAALLFAFLALPVIFLGSRSLNWLGPTRKWVAIGLRLSVMWVLVLLLAGAHWIRQNRDLEVIVLRDLSTSTSNVTPPHGQTLTAAVDNLVESECKSKRPGDQLGIVGFDRNARIEALPDDHLHLDSHPMSRAADGTDIASALRLGLASFRQDAMRRLVLVSDGNATQGDTDSAISAAGSMKIPIDVLPLHYQIQRDVMVDRINAPTSKQLNEPFSIDVILRSTSVSLVTGSLNVTENNQPLSSTRVELHAGANPFHVDVPATSRAGLAEFRATFIPNRAIDDALSGNNSAEAFTFLRGSRQALYIDGELASGSGALLSALQSHGIPIPQSNHITPTQFPTRLIDLEPFDAIILSNVSRGPQGLSPEQDHLLASYVRDLGGGLIMIGGPDTLGPGNWHGSEVEKVLPVDCDIPAERVIPAGAMVIVIDHSGSMSDPMPGSSTLTKQQLAGDAAILALQSLQKDDLAGVIGFSDEPEWVVPLSSNTNPDRAADRIRAMTSTDGTNICPALGQACDALEKVTPEQASVKRILLLTDGMSDPGNYEALIQRLRAAHITLSTIAVGGDADVHLLKHLAQGGSGMMYAVDSPDLLRQAFIREARTLRRALIHEPPGGIDLVQDLDGFAMPKLSGMVLTSLKPDPRIRVPIYAAGAHHDPILAQWSVGLGHTAVFTSDATTRWAAQWTANPGFGRFWSQLVRDVARPEVSNDFGIQLTRDGAKTKLAVEAIGDQGDAKSFLNLAGKLANPDESTSDITLQQTGPGRYEATLDTRDSGTYAAFINYSDASGKSGTLLAGLSVPTSVELRDMQSNEAGLADIAARTNGRLLPPLGAGIRAGLFDRETLSPSVSSHPIDDVLLCILMGMLVTDVAVRRIHWDWKAMKHWAYVGVASVQGFTTTRKINAEQTLAALKHVHTARPSRAQVVVLPEKMPQTKSTRMDTKPIAQSSLKSLRAAKERALEEIRNKGKTESTNRTNLHE